VSFGDAVKYLNLTEVDC